MKNIYQLVFIFAALVLVLSSCSLQKRLYMNGYHVQWRVEGDESDLAKQDISEELEKVPLVAADESNGFTASLIGDDKFIPLKQPAIINGRMLANPTVQLLEECDVIVKKDGVEISAKVMETSSDLVKYKDCDNQQGPLFILELSEIAKIKYADGTSEIFFSKSKEESDRDSRMQEEVKKLAESSYLLGILSFIPFYGIFAGIIAIIKGMNALEKYSHIGMNDPYVKKRAKMGKVLGTIATVLWICLPILAVLLIFL